MRWAGYGFIRDHRTGHDSFVRRLGSGFYPRLHMYIEEQGDRIALNLHLDQKQASYAGARMHNAEYDGPPVEEEISRLKNLLISQNSGNQAPASADNGADLLKKIEFLRNHLETIPEARFHNCSEIPEIMKKLQIDKIVRINA